MFQKRNEQMHFRNGTVGKHFKGQLERKWKMKRSRTKMKKKKRENEYGMQRDRRNNGEEACKACLGPWKCPSLYFHHYILSF